MHHIEICLYNSIHNIPKQTQIIQHSYPHSTHNVVDIYFYIGVGGYINTEMNISIHINTNMKLNISIHINVHIYIYIEREVYMHMVRL